MMTSAPPACPPAPTGPPGYPSPSPSPSPAVVASAVLDADVDSASLRLKRPLNTVSDTCKKRRKQSTPIRISSTTGTGTDLNDLNLGLCYEGKIPSSTTTFPSIHSPDPEPEHEDLNTNIALPTVKVEAEQSPSPAEPSSPSLPVNLSGGQNFPPWLSDVQSSKTNDWLSASASASTVTPTSSLTNHNFYVPVPVSRTTSVSQPPIRIFNPEAYCELCNKEFCNKYFLKTHKANKHRIYTDPPTTSSTSDTLSLPPVNVPSFTATTTAIAMKKPVSMSMTMSETLKNSPLVNVNTDFMGIFCDLCGKSFANKMMLKTHRLSVHGAVDQDTTTTESESLSLGLGLPMDPAVHKEERDPDLGEIQTDKDSNNMFYKTEHFKEDLGISQMSTIDQDENTENQNRDRDNMDFSVNRPRRLGIMNPEAFCEICCKEYCNKYFLRTHKMKRHGILIPDENSKDNQKDFKLELSISNNWYQIQTSPLNLIMGEQNTNSSGSYSERKSSPANENECEICGMRFQTLYLAQLHFATAHSQCKPNNMQIQNEEFSANNNDKQAPDSISEDLQKLQTMILQLNDLDVSKVGVCVPNNGPTLCTCSMCGKEFENRYFLHAHLMTEHGVLLENNVSQMTEKQFEMDNGGEITPEVLHQQQQQQQPQQQHTDNQPKIPNSSTISTPTSISMSTSSVVDKKDDSNGFMGPEKSLRTNGNAVGSERRSSVTMTPTNSYCEICNKELCNKYFMKTHMQRMHGIEIENGAQIGGVVCNICNKELCSKYFLRVHKHNTHGIVQDNIGGTSNSSQSQTRQPSLDLEQHGSLSLTTPVAVIPPSTEVNVSAGAATDPALKLGDLSDLSNRYFTHFTEVCTICSRRFRSTKWLKAHLLGDHGKAGTEKWNELEIQLQQSFSSQQQTQQRKNSISDRSTSSPTLRIPNGGQGQDNIKSEGGVQNVLSTIFGTDETNVKQYHCSYCSFSTPVLAFLFVHERSHSHNRGMGMTEVQNSSNSTNTNTNTTSTTTSAISPLYCAVCNQSFRQPEQLHHHIVSQHTFLSFFGNVRQPLPQIQQQQQIEPSTPTKTEPKREDEPKSLEDQKCPKCTTCGGGNKLEFTTDMSITLKDVSKQRQLPASYALPQPQSQSQFKAKYMMQAFLMDEPTRERDAGLASLGTEHTLLAAGASGTVAVVERNGDEEQSENINTNSNAGINTSTSTDRRFAPSIVFLPVLEKLTAPLTVSFTLTPA